VENLLPRVEVEFAVDDRHDHLAVHHLAFQMRAGIVLAGAVVTVLTEWLMRDPFLQLDSVIMVESVFIVVEEDRGGDVYSIA